MIGEFGQPGVMYLDRPTTVLQAVAQAHGMTPTADLRMARVLRDGQLLPVDLRRLLDEGDMSQNIWLNAGDTIYIPHNLNQLVFVMGGVNRPGPVAMHDGQLNLLEALSQAGGMPNTETNWREVRIIRTHSATRGEFITVDAVRLLEGEALPVMLESGDVVFVPTAPIGDWNDVIREIQPTFQLIGSFANPFILLRSVSR
jgi:polysaccharide export outer membrane protein